MANSDGFLSERMRAEDIILGSLGYGEEAKILSIESTQNGYHGRAAWLDGEVFEFSSEETPSALEQWAIGVLTKALSRAA